MAERAPKVDDDEAAQWTKGEFLLRQGLISHAQESQCFSALRHFGGQGRGQTALQRSSPTIAPKSSHATRTELSG